jgi:hypothetical protein
VLQTEETRSKKAEKGKAKVTLARSLRNTASMYGMITSIPCYTTLYDPNATNTIHQHETQHATRTPYSRRIAALRTTITARSQHATRTPHSQYHHTLRARITHHASHITHHLPRITHTSRITYHAPRIRSQHYLHSKLKFALEYAFRIS